MKPIGDEQLEATLRAIRPRPKPEFAAELDQAVADGFPDPRSPKAWLARLGERLSSTPPRRFLVPAGGVALAAIAISTAVIVTGNDGEGTNSVAVDSQSQRSTIPDWRGIQFESSIPRVTEEGAAAAPGRSQGAHGAAASHGSGQGSPEAQYDDAPPATSASKASGNYQEAAGSTAQPVEVGPYASGTAHRDIERAAQIVLAAEPSEVREDAAQVFEAVHAANGIVLDSSIRDGRAGRAGARFELLIPSAKLSDAMASFSSIASVRTRHESTSDITAPTIGAGEHLEDANAAVRGLLGRLAEADSDAERAAVEAELRTARAKAATIRSRLSTLERRSNLSRVSLRIETDGESDGSGGGGTWGIGDGLHGAGRVLAVAAGVIVIAAAILAPLALLLLIGWLVHRGWSRRARRQALDRP